MKLHKSNKQVFWKQMTIFKKSLISFFVFFIGICLLHPTYAPTSSDSDNYSESIKLLSSIEDVTILQFSEQGTGGDSSRQNSRSPPPSTKSTFSNGISWEKLNNHFLDFLITKEIQDRSFKRAKLQILSARAHPPTI